MPATRGQNMLILLKAFQGGAEAKEAAVEIVVDKIEAQELTEGGGIIAGIEAILEEGISTPDAEEITAMVAGKIVDLFQEV